MKRHHELLLSVWREACRHIELDESLARIAPLLADPMALHGMQLFHVDPDLKRVERLGAVLEDDEATLPAPALDARRVATLARWCKTGTPVAFNAAAPVPAIPLELCDALSNQILALPLRSEHDTLGVLMLGAQPGHRFGDADARLAELLCEPLAVALENDRRLNELIALREAAEADKIKLLHRLGREALTNEIIGAKGGLRSVLERAALVSRSEVPVLIFGETGAGKEVVARAIHDSSPRANGPFIRVNCGAIPHELIDSELFGHEKGSFTGATGSRRGWFERADGGTLFLDEIGELSAAAQVRLLRVVQEGVFERVGGEQSLHVNVRIVAATHRDLAMMVREHSFREDLWYRIAVFPIMLPPLRERLEDIPELAAHFADRAARRFGLRPQTPTEADLALLAAYSWPGNVREFASVLDRAALLGDGARLEVAAALGIAPVGQRASGQAVAPDIAETGPIVTLDEAMKRHIERALAHTGGKIEGKGGVADLLDINPHTLRARMRKLRVEWNSFRK
ncbi:MAG: sigma 54-interacting transcriptional regulator [Candidatus Hydrogenedentes bacterium]|nr:sigma 54-interacting transcriptional regulator [Candidatus Hydrogenedentota bacterium]